MAMQHFIGGREQEWEVDGEVLHVLCKLMVGMQTALYTHRLCLMLWWIS